MAKCTDPRAWETAGEALAVPLAWLLVVVCPIGAGIALHPYYPASPALPWVGAALTLALAFLCVEWIWRALRWLLTAGRVW
jgi:hypothetical protein